MPWAVEIAGNAEVTGSFTLEDILAIAAQEERVYRMSCVEGWSMVIPWIGIPLARVLAPWQILVANLQRDHENALHHRRLRCMATADPTCRDIDQSDDAQARAELTVPAWTRLRHRPARLLHFLWQLKYGEKIAVIEPVIYLGIYLALIAMRVPGWIKLVRQRRAPVSAGFSL